MAFKGQVLTPALLSEQLYDRICHKLSGLSPVRILACLSGGNKGLNDRFYSTLSLLLGTHKRHSCVEQIAQIQPLLGGGGLAADGSS